MGKYPWSGRRTLDHCRMISKYQGMLGKPRQQDGKCEGYQKSKGDDEPCETCKECKLNTFYED